MLLSTLPACSTVVYCDATDGLCPSLIRRRGVYFGCVSCRQALRNFPVLRMDHKSVTDCRTLLRGVELAVVLLCIIKLQHTMSLARH